MYKVIWEIEAEKDLITILNAEKIVKRMESYFAHAPHKLSKPLTGKWKGFYRYRYGNYRIIYEIDSSNNTIIISRVGHRSEIY